MDWGSVKYFLAIARTGSLKEASYSLGVNHSTVFRRLNSLENDIDGRLFERLPGGYELTSLGEELLLFAQNIDDTFNDLERKLMGKDIQPKGLVKITAPSSFAYSNLPEILGGLKGLYPEIPIELLVSNSEFNMTNRQADICLRVTSSPPEHLVGRQIGSIGWGVYAGLGYIKEFGQPRNLNDLSRHSLIGATGEVQKHAGFSWLDTHYPDQIHIRCDDLVGMACLASAGRGLAILPDDLHQSGIDKLLAFEPAGRNQVWILTHPDLRKVERIKVVMRHLSQAFLKETAFQQD